MQNKELAEPTHPNAGVGPGIYKSLHKTAHNKSILFKFITKLYTKQTAQNYTRNKLSLKSQKLLGYLEERLEIKCAH